MEKRGDKPPPMKKVKSSIDKNSVIGKMFGNQMEIQKIKENVCVTNYNSFANNLLF